jgi:hypothetical protein
VDKIIRNVSIGSTASTICAHLGRFAAGAAYGEWAPDELKDRIGFVPHGLEEFSDLWHAPLQDYNIPNAPSFKGSKLVSSAGYILSVVFGVIVSGSFLYLIGKKAAKH